MSNDQLVQTVLLYYLPAVIIGVAISYFFSRWIFSINKRVKQNESIINLLKLLAEKEGVSQEEIKSACVHSQKTDLSNS